MRAMPCLQGPLQRPPGSSVKLVCPANVHAGTELHLDYGDKGTEELLFVYGARWWLCVGAEAPQDVARVIL